MKRMTCLTYFAAVTSFGAVLLFGAAGCATRVSRPSEQAQNSYHEIYSPENDVSEQNRLPAPLEASPSEAEREVEEQASRAPVRAVELNTATVEELARIPGIDRKQAEQIVAYRRKAGEFYKMSDLLFVKGFDQAKLVAVQPWVTIEPLPGRRPSTPPGISPGRLGPVTAPNFPGSSGPVPGRPEHGIPIPGSY